MTGLLKGDDLYFMTHQNAPRKQIMKLDLRKPVLANAQVVAVVSNRPQAPGLAWAAERGIPTVVIDHQSHAGREPFDAALAQAIEKEGFEVLGATSYGDLSQFAQQQSRASAFILSIDDEEFTPGPELDPAVLSLRKFIEEIRCRNVDIPIYIYGETRTSQHIPNDILRELHGFIHMFEDTPEFVARHIIREAKSYLEGVQPPFFKALLDYAEDGSYSWHCPGHSGGVAFLNRADLWRECHRSAGAANQPWLAALGLVGGVGRLDLFANANPVLLAVGHHVGERAVAGAGNS